MSLTLCATLLVTAYGDLPGAYYGAPGYGYSAPVMYGYGVPAYGYGYPASIDPCPVTAGYGTAAAGYGTPHGYSAQRGYGVRAAYGPTAGRPRSAMTVVHMTDRARFEPAQVTIKAGETVEWRNASRHPHTVTLNPDLAKNPAHVVLPEGAEPFDSGEIAPGGRITHTFTVPGIYFYVCQPHEEKGMIGIVVVEPSEGRGPDRGQGGAPPGGAGGGY